MPPKVSIGGGNPVMVSWSFHHSPLEGESANQGRSLPIFRWGEKAVPFQASSASSRVDATPCNPLARAFHRRFKDLFSVGFSTCHSRSSMPSKVSIGGGNPDKPSREAKKADAVGGLPAPHTPLTFSLPFRPRIPRIFQVILNCFRSAAQTTSSSRQRRGWRGLSRV